MPEEKQTPPRRTGIFARFRALIRKLFGITSYFEIGNAGPPLDILFNHLYSEYRTVRHLVAQLPNVDAVTFIESLPERLVKDTLSWSDLYNFQLILADVLPAEQLRTKIRRLRFDFRSVAGQKEFDDYMASKPPDLQSPPQPGADHSKDHYESLLRDDLKDLLGRMYLEYAILPIREERLTNLTWVAARLCLFSLIALLGILGILFFAPLFEIVFLGENSGGIQSRFQALSETRKLSSLTIFVVVISGAMGGFVSALQRIQSPPSEGDSLYNLSLLFHGSYSVFVSPITGGIFAIILYLLFTSGTLSGSFFPNMYTSIGTFTELKEAVPKPSPTVAPANSNSAAANTTANTNTSATTEPGQAPGNIESTDQTATNSQSGANTKAKPSPQPTAMTKPVPERGIDIFTFLAESGPARGQDYALLIVWCFIAGFAERFVPDALDRLVRSSVGNKK
ncbi:MAG: hypothetical protein ABL984_15465 [Pyrinomonadaceae bacterium]